MKDFTNFEEYELNEAEIDKAIHILSVFKQRDISPEEAIDFLVWLRTQVHLKAHSSNLVEMMKLYDTFTKEKRSEG